MFSHTLFLRRISFVVLRFIKHNVVSCCPAGYVMGAPPRTHSSVRARGRSGTPKTGLDVTSNPVLDRLHHSTTLDE